MTTITIDLDEDAIRRLQELSSGAGLTISELTRDVVESFLEDMKDARDAEDVLARIARGEEGTIALDELERRLGLGS
jgi:Predicted DNA-binding protein with an HTH domain